ncbi:hypothetical protein [Frigoribacterium faeni]|uniref:Uncharacterized protein n=1 Tax=Frigoribacterium faeni TaxID=145483 RepID=A0A7W3PIG7_9MICO|nr:hypothetical protein [Frigoribacterium faeni]MBA8812654.1 hypothetical protein [Frigoribacterium faeni]BFF13764.1 hypothetical protein GCM10025699_50670 [Microbacterium flavescens]GEK82333.1 hypothetical protein FFA01_06420 [Frigoribacterium faeni]
MTHIDTSNIQEIWFKTQRVQHALDSEVEALAVGNSVETTGSKDGVA